MMQASVYLGNSPVSQAVSSDVPWGEQGQVTAEGRRQPTSESPPVNNGWSSEAWESDFWRAWNVKCRATHGRVSTSSIDSTGSIDSTSSTDSTNTMDTTSSMDTTVSEDHSCMDVDDNNNKNNNTPSTLLINIKPNTMTTLKDDTSNCNLSVNSLHTKEEVKYDSSPEGTKGFSVNSSESITKSNSINSGTDTANANLDNTHEVTKSKNNSTTSDSTNTAIANISEGSKESSSKGDGSSSEGTKDMTGRTRLLDADGFILRAACVCVDETESKVLLVSSKDRSSWLVPGGGVEAGEDTSTAAIREAWEEAGVQGNIARYLGLFETQHHSGRKRHRTAVFVVTVKQVQAQYPEAHLGRRREWFSMEDALSHLSRHRPVQSAYLQLLLVSRLALSPA